MMNRILIGIAIAGLAVCLSPLAEQSCAAAEPARNASELLRAFSNVEFFWQQKDIAEEMIRLGDKSVIAGVAPFLTSKSRCERCNAGLVLAGLGDNRGAAIILGEFHDKGARPTELRRSDNKPDPKSQIAQDRYYAALLLGRLRERSAVSALIDALKDETINDRAAISLGEIGDRSAVPALLAMSHESPKSRLWAGYGLAQLGEQAGFDILVETLPDSSWVQRRHAVEALGTIGERRMAPYLVKALQDERVEVRISAAVSLGKLGDLSALAPLQQSLQVSEINQKNVTGVIDKDDLTREAQFTVAGNRAVELIKARGN